jgi:hypothetical protein
MKAGGETIPPSFPRRRESSLSRVGGDMGLFRAAARGGLDSRLRGNDGGKVGINSLISKQVLSCRSVFGP